MLDQIDGVFVSGVYGVRRMTRGHGPWRLRGSVVGDHPRRRRRVSGSSRRALRVFSIAVPRSVALDGRIDVVRGNRTRSRRSGAPTWPRGARGSNVRRRETLRGGHGAARVAACGRSRCRRGPRTRADPSWRALPAPADGGGSRGDPNARRHTRGARGPAPTRTGEKAKRSHGRDERRRVGQKTLRWGGGGETPRCQARLGLLRR